jgi:type VI secretion system protein ImpI
LKYWELYREHYQTLGRDAHEAFRRLFGEELARAYEEQLEKQKARDRAP